MIEQDVSLAPLISKDYKLVKRQCFRPCNLYQISTSETTGVQVRSCFGPTTQKVAYWWEVATSGKAYGNCSVAVTWLECTVICGLEPAGRRHPVGSHRTLLASALQCNDLENGVERESIRHFKARRELWILKRLGIYPVLSRDAGWNKQHLISSGFCSGTQDSMAQGCLHPALVKTKIVTVSTIPN